MRRCDATRGVLIALAALAFAPALAGCGAAKDYDGLHGFTRSPPLRVGDVGLPDVAPGGAGRTMAFRAEPSGLLLVYFGYTFCPDVCPTTLADVGLALKRLPRDQRQRVAVGMATVDPARDTPAVLNGYLGHFFPAWHAFRTTSAARLRRVEHAFKAMSRLGPKGRAGGYEVGHTAVTYAVDEAGTVRAEWPFGTTSADLAADLRELLKTESRKDGTS